jgi:hypothetical protein
MKEPQKCSRKRERAGVPSSYLKMMYLVLLQDVETRITDHTIPKRGSANLPLCININLYRRIAILFFFTPWLMNVVSYAYGIPSQHRLGAMGWATETGNSIFGSDMPAFGCTLTSRCRATAGGVLLPSLRQMWIIAESLWSIKATRQVYIFNDSFLGAPGFVDLGIHARTGL